jgi:hypothetical protein
MFVLAKWELRASDQRRTPVPALPVFGVSVDPLGDVFMLPLPEGLAALFAPAPALPAPLLMPVVAPPVPLVVPLPVAAPAAAAPPPAPPPAPPAPAAYEACTEVAAISPTTTVVKIVFRISISLVASRGKVSPLWVVPFSRSSHFLVVRQSVRSFRAPSSNDKQMAAESRLEEGPSRYGRASSNSPRCHVAEHGIA